MHPDRSAHEPRRGFVLPLVLVATILVALLAGAAQFAAWRASRAAKQAWNSERALLAADEAMATRVASWSPEQFAQIGIGASRTSRYRTASQVDVDVSLTRTQPLAALIAAEARSQSDGAPTLAQRSTERAIFLLPPPLPLHSALLVLAPAHLLGTAQLSGIDSAPHDECGPWRDTASINGLRAYPATVDTTVGVLGIGAPRTARTLMQDAADFDRAWPQLTSRAVARASPVGALPVEPAWRALVVHDSVGVRVAGTWRHEGLLAVDHDLVVRDTLHLRGLLVVRGALDVTVGSLQVDGAVIVRGQSVHTTRIGNGARVRYDQCAVRRALAAVATPSEQPFRHWSER